MKALIIFYSHSGNNEKLALVLKDRLGCEIHQIREVKKRKTISILLDFFFNTTTKLSSSNLPINKYDNVIFVGPVWGSKIATPIKAYIEKEKNNLCNYSFITLCNGDIGQKEKLSSQLSTIAQRQPYEVMELWVKSLLPDDKKNKIKHTFNFRVSYQDLVSLDEDITSFIRLIHNFDATA